MKPWLLAQLNVQIFHLAVMGAPSSLVLRHLDLRLGKVGGLKIPGVATIRSAQLLGP